ncbi:hypothetical protein GGR44_001236 [Sphingobium fontiphilum]|uniref:Exoprotein n=1 Tax=Sphingobium fontiphilum TaxID=944425 RepID=A0A7W6GQ12_9SPHN|nr:YdbH domain-containing protein [Sphingobium fontiphilum]MBB3981589.1 hypothetical protein [Sphingobium fontiphilum]
MDEEIGEQNNRRGWLRWLGIGVGMVPLVLAGLWTQRAPIAENFINREFNKRGVRGSYDLIDIGLRTQRIENIVLGDPNNPDLTARWVEVDISFTDLTPTVAAIRAGGVRMRGALRDNVLTLGELDKFRGAASTEPFALPDLVVALKDARMGLTTDYGAVGIALDGRGNLQSGFSGRVGAAMPRGRIAGCGMTDARGFFDLSIAAGRPHIAGPVSAAALGCPQAVLARPGGAIDLTLGEALDRWNGRAALRADAVRAQGVVMSRPDLKVDFDGHGQDMTANVRLTGQAFRGGGVLAEGVALDSRWSLGGGMEGRGALTARNVRMASADPLASLRQSTAATPVGPLMQRLAQAVRDAGRDNGLRGRFALARRGAGGSIVIDEAALSARSGARVQLAPGGRMQISWPGPAGVPIDWALNGSLTSEGGGLPRAALRLARRAGGGFGGQLFVDPYAAGDARLALEPVRFVAGADGRTHFATHLQMDGPLADGGLRGLSLPLEGDVAPGGAVRVNPRCVPLSFDSVRYAGFALGRTRQTLCPAEGGALLAYGPGGLRGGAEVAKLDLQGTSGDSPMRLTADRARMALSDGAFALNGAQWLIGPQDAPVRLAAARLDGRFGADGIGGTMAGGEGRIGTVPLLIEKAEGPWRFDKGVLSLKAGLTVKDAQTPGRFNPLDARDFSLSMRDGRIVASASLTAPRNGATVAAVVIGHDLGSGEGQADLKVPGLVFGEGLRPEDVTGLARGVVANVKATVTGEGQVRWKGDKVTSDGVFRTDNASLAAAFGPVDGLSGELRFTDLIGLVSAPGQEVRIASTNPGVAVRDGVVKYQLLPGQKVRLEGGEWPFAGGRLLLLPTVMDFSADSERYMTFRVIGLDAGAFIQTLELENISATGTFDGIMPLIFNQQGGRVAGGVLVARQQGMPPLIMPEGVLPTIPCDPKRQSGTLSYVGPVSNEQVGAMGKLAFDALKDLQYKCLTILMDGALDGEMVTNVVFNGVNRGQLGGAPAGLAGNFTGLPFIFNVRISAPFRGLMGTPQSLVDPNALIRNSLGDDYQDKLREGVAVQPSESETMPNGERK